MRYNGAQTNAIEKRWYSGDFTGDNRAVARCTVHRGNVRLTSGGQYGDFASIIFSVGALYQGGQFTYFPREIPNIKSVSWNRDTGTQVATATIEIFNNANLPDGTIGRGYLTWNRGDSSFAKARKIPTNTWHGMIVPDNVIRTFEGYGADWTKGPETDPNLLCTGNWLIDKVAISGNIITLTCRDFGRILIDQIIFPPITPRSSTIPGISYPVYFDSYQTSYVDEDSYASAGLAFAGSSNTPYVGVDGYQNGHYAREAMDGNSDTYWLSIGNSAPNAGYSYEWIQGSCGNQRIGSVSLHALYGNLQGYVSVLSNGSWVNAIGVIPYDPNNPSSAPNGSNIPAVSRFVTTGSSQRVTFGPYPNVTAVRLTFTNLQNSGVGPYVYRAGVREFGVASTKTNSVKRVTKPADFNYSDYTDIIKLFCAWGGFHWPADGPYTAISKGVNGLFPQGVAFQVAGKPANDKYLKYGRIWGDLEQTGTYGAVSLTIDNFDKKTLMDGIQVVQDTVGFLFYIDEAGGVNWRFPNYKQRGNLVNGRRQQRFIRILDTQTLRNITLTLDSRNARERVYVASPEGKYVGSTRGYNLNPIGLRRIAGYIDRHWSSTKEVQTAAQLIAIAQMMSYRTLTVTIAGLPTMQMDDQIEVVDTDTGEGYLNYVSGIASKLDMVSGEYSYDLTCSWLGARANGGDWAFDKFGKLAPNTQVLLDYYDRHRKDGAYDSFAPVTIPLGN